MSTPELPEIEAVGNIRRFSIKTSIVLPASVEIRAAVNESAGNERRAPCNTR